MKALVLTAPHEFAIKEIACPKPGPNEVLCRVRAIAICGTDADTMAFDVAALGDTASIALHSVKRPGIQPGDTFVAVGSGGMGLLTAMCARALGAARVLVVGGGKRLERARGLDFETVDYHDGDP